MSARLVVIIAVLVRVAWVLAVPSRPVGDFAMYLESAAHLLEHGALDPEFVYMPGYIGFAAAIFALGGGVLVVKLVVAVAAGLVAGAVYGIAAALWEERAGAPAGLAYALWPAGIAVTSVTGTDVPAAILIVLAVWLLTRLGATRPWTAALAFGAVMGVAATVRAVAVPLAGFSLFYYWATAKANGFSRWRGFVIALARAALATVVALALLSPWAWRNHARYGEWFITDSHGGLTALVGANPNTDGRYSRSLNRMFKEVTGYTLLAEPHRAADRASYDITRELVAFSPPYALGLVVAKAERLLRDQRALLYWPIYRAGVLGPGLVRDALARARPVLEVVVDVYWWMLVATFFAGVGLAAARRRWDILWYIPIAVALAGIYALFFAEVRYSLPIATLMFPVAGGVMVFLRDAVAHVRRMRRVPRGLMRETAWAFAAVALIAVLAPATGYAGTRLRERHRFGVHVFEQDGRAQLLKWRRDSGGDSPVRGVWNGVGLALARRDGEGRVGARAELALPAGRYWLQGHWDVAPAGDAADAEAEGDDVADLAAGAMVTLRANDKVIAEAPLSALVGAGRTGRALPSGGEVVHPGGALVLRFEARGTPAVALPPSAHVWLSRVSLVKPDGAPRAGGTTVDVARGLARPGAPPAPQGRTQTPAPRGRAPIRR